MLKTVFCEAQAHTLQVFLPLSDPVLGIIAKIDGYSPMETAFGLLSLKYIYIKKWRKKELRR